MAARAALAGTGDLTAPGCVRRPGYRSMVHRSRRMPDGFDGCNFHLERRVAPDELERGLARVLGLADGAVRSVEREIEVTGRWLWSGGVDVAYEHPGAGFGTYCELRCDLDDPAPLDVLVALSAVLGTRALRHFEIDEPTRVCLALARLGWALDGDGPAVRHLLEPFEPGAGPRATLVEPEASDGPSTTRFPASG